MNHLVFPEYIVAPWKNHDVLRQRIASAVSVANDDVSAELREKLNVGKSLEQLALEFLGQFV